MQGAFVNIFLNSLQRRERQGRSAKQFQCPKPQKAQLSKAWKVTQIRTCLSELTTPQKSPNSLNLCVPIYPHTDKAHIVIGSTRSHTGSHAVPLELTASAFKPGLPSVMSSSKCLRREGRQAEGTNGGCCLMTSSTPHSVPSYKRAVGDV